MNNGAKIVLTGVAALIIGAVLGVAYGDLQVDEVNQKLAATIQERDLALQNVDRLRKMNAEAEKRYGTNLGKLIVAAPAGDDPVKLIDYARMILTTRDGYRSSLDAARLAMNSEFDALAAELGNTVQSPDRVKAILDGLKQDWPSKERNLDDATRKVLIDLGLVQAPPPAQAPAAPPAASAPPPAAPSPAPAPAEKK